MDLEKSVKVKKIQLRKPERKREGQTRPRYRQNSAGQSNLV